MRHDSHLLLAAFGANPLSSPAKHPRSSNSDEHPRTYPPATAARSLSLSQLSSSRPTTKTDVMDDFSSAAQAVRPNTRLAPSGAASRDIQRPRSLSTLLQRTYTRRWNPSILTRQLLCDTVVPAVSAARLSRATSAWICLLTGTRSRGGGRHG